jgi:hypothetical protein
MGFQDSLPEEGLMRTFEVLARVQANRTLAAPAKLADNAFRAVALGDLQRRNAALDAVFYDVATISDEELPALAFWLAREGATILVPPSRGGRLKVFLSATEFLASGQEVGALTVAGVGSSALGAAAFGRNVADAIGRPVAAVVSGYGLADVFTEALGGYFLFGALNSLRHLFEPLDAISKTFSLTEQAIEERDGVSWARGSRDTQTVIDLLRDAHFRPELVVGHSKGNLVISEALYTIEAIDDAQARALAGRTCIVTVSARIGMPAAFRDVLDIMGEYDWFGALNSRPDIPADIVVRGAWHSTNPEFPLGMGIRVTDTLRRALQAGGAQRSLPYGPSAPLADFPQRAAARLIVNVSRPGSPRPSSVRKQPRQS